RLVWRSQRRPGPTRHHPWHHPGITLGITLASPWHHPGLSLARPWPVPGPSLGSVLHFFVGAPLPLPSVPALRQREPESVSLAIHRCAGAAGPPRTVRFRSANADACAKALGERSPEVLV